MQHFFQAVKNSTLVLFFACSWLNAQIAITEFINNPIGLDDEREWIELYNYSGATVNLNGYIISDEDTDSFRVALNDVFMPSESYLILARNKAAFEAEWLGGVPNEQVIEWLNISDALANSTDEIYLKDSMANMIWNLAYGNDDDEAAATFLTYDTGFSLSDWGNKTLPAIVRAGIDAVPGDLLGYESNEDTPDFLAYASSNGDIGSPLLGNYNNSITSTTVQLTLVLEGAFDSITNSMTNLLNTAGLLPSTQSYTAAPFNYNGTENVTTFSIDAVDWVLVEIWSADYSSRIAQKAGILLSNGSVMDADGSLAGLNFSNLVNGESYQILVRHRNHLAVVSAAAVMVNANSLSYNFSSSDAQALGMQLVQVAPNYYALKAGDATADGVFSYADATVYFTNINTNSYHAADFNLDGLVNENDYNYYGMNSFTIGVSAVRY